MTLDPVKELKELSTKREDLVTRHARLRVIGEQAEKEDTELQTQLKEVGTSDETLETDLSTAMTQMTEQIAVKRQELETFEAKVKESEQLLAQNKV